MKNKIAILGKGRLKSDFRYLFPEIEFENDFESVYECMEYVSLSARKGIKIKILLCENTPLEEMKNTLENAGYNSGKDFVTLRQYLKSINTGSVILWGTGKICRSFLRKNPNLTVSFYVDNNSQISEFRGKMVVLPEELKKKIHGEKIIIANSYYSEISKQLIQMGFREYFDFINYSLFVDFEDLIEKVLFSNPVADINCTEPFEHCQIAGGGEMNLCCLGLTMPAGEIYHSPFLEVWNSKLARIVRLSVINKTFLWCDERVCPYIVRKAKYEYEELYNPEFYKLETCEYPKRLNISIDHTCNLKCEHCRNDILIASPEEKEMMEVIAERLESEVMSHAEVLIMAGNGEVFFSDIYIKMWKYEISDSNLKRKRINILTNGILFTDEIWQDLEIRYDEIGIAVSIDACTEETYRKIRKGNFAKLTQVMNKLSTLRKEKRLIYLHMNFVIRQDNCHELHDFILWGKRLGVDRIYISKVENWIYPEEKFEKVSVFDDDNCVKAQFQKYFSDPILREPIVSMINIQKSLK